MAASVILTLQTHHQGLWHDAAELEIEQPEFGIGSPSRLAYVDDYFFEYGLSAEISGHPLRDARALSVGLPLNLEFARFQSWPPFLLDLLPQGHARRRLLQILDREADSPEAELPLLRRAAGAPIGNIRLKEASEDERNRLEGEPIKGIAYEEIFERSDGFRDLATRFALIASGSSGVQGEWPKILMTRADDGLWYPDPAVPDARAREHVIVKLARGRHGTEYEYAILGAEAPYLEVARAIGCRVGRPLTHRDGTLVIPRFDRTLPEGEGVRRFGQESLVAAAGIAKFGHVTTHEAYLDVIKAVATNPAEEVTEYVLRDLLNVAMGNTDNHGRNTALRKTAEGWIGLTPLFDFAPMRLDPNMVVPATHWGCLKGRSGSLDLGCICAAAAQGVMDPDNLAETLARRLGTFEELPEIARDLGTQDWVVERAFTRHAEVVRAIRSLADSGHGPANA